jgi:MoxR-like ATPase
MADVGRAAGGDGAVTTHDDGVLARFAACLGRSLRAGVRAITIVSDDEERTVVACEDTASALGLPVRVWSATDAGDPTTRTLGAVLDKIHHAREPGLWVLREPGPSLDAIALRRCREIAQRTIGPAIVLVEPNGGRTDALAAIPEMVELRLDPPDAAELGDRLQQIARALADAGFPDAPAALARGAAAIVGAAAGLPSFAFERILAEAVLACGLDIAGIVQHVRRSKPDVIGRGGLLEPVRERSADELGGLDALKQWLATRRRTFDPAAATAGIPAARGCLLLGVQGCGKSLAARVCGDALGLPLVRLEPGRLFGSAVGQSEANLRRALADADRMAPAVLWIDELDKGFAGADGSASDAGTAARVLGGLLTWLQERTAPLFVVATANRVDVLPPELLRRGRFDEVFFIDLPDADAREAITAVHFASAAAGAEDPWSAFVPIARAADGHSGAELAAALLEARTIAYAEGRALRATDLAAALQTSIPLSVLRAEDVAALRRWAAGRARPA